jgi:cytoskeletal protein CcmA (bactofilin family)
LGLFGKPDAKPDSPAPRPPAAPAAAAAIPASNPAPAVGASRASVIAAKAVFKGELLGDEDVVIEGLVEGQIRISREVRVAPGGTVRAAVSAQSLVVSGTLVGDCTATTRIEIQATGRVTGDIRAPRIVVTEGASFKGRSETTGRDGKPGKPGPAQA